MSLQDRINQAGGTTPGEIDARREWTATHVIDACEDGSLVGQPCQVLATYRGTGTIVELRSGGRRRLLLANEAHPRGVQGRLIPLAPVRRSGRSRLHGRPLDENGAIEFGSAPPQPATRPGYFSRLWTALWGRS